MGSNFKKILNAVLLVLIVAAVIGGVVMCSKRCAGNSDGGDFSYYTKIASVEDLKSIETIGSYRLDADIDLSGIEWTPIAEFGGTIEGQGHEIRNMTITSSDAKNIGFVGQLSGAINNVTFINVNIDVSTREANVGGVIGSLVEGGWMENVRVSGSVKANRSATCGGLIGNLDSATVRKSFAENIEVVGKTNVGGKYGKARGITFGGYSANGVTVSGETNVGGIVGYVEYVGDMSDLKNTGNISGESCVGGIFGYCNYSVDATVSSFINEGKITCSGDYAGGIIGRVKAGTYSKIKIENLNNTGDVSGNAYVGGLFGYCENEYELDKYYMTLTNSKSSSNVSGTWSVGGIAGYAKALTITKCSNEGAEITASGYNLEKGEKRVCLGGYVGNGYALSFADCTNNVNLNTADENYYVGGIAGFVEKSRDMLDLNNTGDMGGGSCIGGIFGYIYCYQDSIFSTITNEGKVTCEGDYAGGIVGKASVYCYAKPEMENLNNNGDVSGDGYVGGLFGYLFNEFDNINCFTKLTNTTNNSKIIGKWCVGGIVGYAKGVIIKKSANDGSIIMASGYTLEDGKKSTYLGGYIGKGEYVSISECTNKVVLNVLTSCNYVGGIAGYIKSHENNMSDLKNTEFISGGTYVGGIFGYMHAYKKITLSSFTNFGQVNAVDYSGGIVGWVNADSYAPIDMDDFNNSASVYSGSYAGGLFGYFYTNSTSHLYSYSTSGNVCGYSKNLEIVG